MAAASNALPTRSRKDVHCEKTTARWPSAMSLRSSFSSSFILVLWPVWSPDDWAASPSATPAADALARSCDGKREAPGRTRNDFRSSPGRRHTGHSPWHCLRILKEHSLQKMWPHGVIVGSSGTSQQIGQSGSSPLRRSSKRFPTKRSERPSPPTISCKQRFSNDCMSSSWPFSRANTRNGWHSACRSLRISCKMCVYLDSASP
mmetsp:Transcript_6185/g.11603  ORF Transcript_6185/g.11603 Transcript_6185/m.11603 type:complete len:204 (+) Transcript_6185:646-1257(+)